jgi:hypothetical protein
MKIKQTLWRIKLRPQYRKDSYMKLSDQILNGDTGTKSMTLEDAIIAIINHNKDEQVGRLVEDSKGNKKSKYSVRVSPLSMADGRFGALRKVEIASSHPWGAWDCYECQIDAGRDNAFTRTSDPMGNRDVDIENTYQMRDLRIFILANSTRHGFWISVESMGNDSPAEPFCEYVKAMLLQVTGIKFTIELDVVSDPTLMLEILKGYDPSDFSVAIPTTSGGNRLRRDEREKREIGIRHVDRNATDSAVRAWIQKPKKKKPMKTIDSIIDRTFITPVSSSAVSKKVIYTKRGSQVKITIDLISPKYDICNYWVNRPSYHVLLTETEHLLKFVD